MKRILGFRLFRPADSAGIGNSSDKVSGRFRLHEILPYCLPVALLLIFRFIFPANFCDDAYISFKTALNLADGNGMVFNQGEKIFVVTTPLWVFLLVATRTLFSDVVLAAKLLGILFEVLLLISIVRLGGSLVESKLAGMLAATLLVTNPVFLLTSFCGMELSLYLFAIIVSIILLADKRYAVGLLVAAIVLWIRIDGLLFYAVALVWSLFIQRHEIMRHVKASIIKISPSLSVVIGYFVFGFSYFGDVIPVSAQKKAQTSAALFSEEWLAGASELFVQFIKAFMGQSSYWFRTDTLFIVLFIPLMVGIVRLCIDKRTAAIPLIVFTLLYVGAFIESGSLYARNFPWYFVPVLPAAFLVSAVGLLWLLSPVATGSTFFYRLTRQRVIFFTVTVMLAVAWVSVTLFGGWIQRDSASLSSSHREREQVYAAATVWLGKHLEEGAIVAANEIGAIGFFSRPDISILDLFGILRRTDERSVSYIDLVKRHGPEVVLTRSGFNYREQIDRELAGAYTWFKFRSLEIGVSSDTVSILEPHLVELENIYDVIDVGKEYDWSRGGKIMAPAIPRQ